jgi:hypothetical protein
LIYILPLSSAFFLFFFSPLSAGFLVIDHSFSSEQSPNI